MGFQVFWSSVWLCFLFVYEEVVQLSDTRALKMVPVTSGLALVLLVTQATVGKPI